MGRGASGVESGAGRGLVPPSPGGLHRAVLTWLQGPPWPGGSGLAVSWPWAGGQERSCGMVRTFLDVWTHV